MSNTRNENVFDGVQDKNGKETGEDTSFEM